MKRRAFLHRGALGAATFGVAKAVHNTVVGYGHFGLGDNLLTQDLDPIAREGMPSLRWRERTVDGRTVRVSNAGVRYEREGKLTRLDEGSPPAIRDLARDLEQLNAGEFAFRFQDLESFFTTLAGETTRPGLVAMLRRPKGPDPSLVETVTDVSPTAPQKLLDRLVSVFRDRSRYDVPRYVAGSIDDNVLPIEADLRDPFAPQVNFARLAETDETIGMFCTEYTRLARAALHAGPVTEQSPPVYSVWVRNRRHKHVYNGIGSVVRTDEGLILPMTFVDYTDTTVIDDFHLTGMLDDSLDAYDGQHRADEIRWW